MSGAHTYGHLLLGAVWVLTSVVQKVEAQPHVGRYTLARCIQKANTLTMVIRKKYALTHCVWKANALALIIQKAYAMAGIVQMPHTLTLVVWKKYALTLCVWKAKCHSVRHLKEIRPDTRRPKRSCCAGCCPDATCRDTHRPEEIRTDTCHMEEIYLDMLRLGGICPATRRPEGTCRGMRRPDATCLTVVDTKKRHHFDNRRLEGYCGAHLRVVHISMAGMCLEHHVHWQEESGSICGGTHR